MCRTNLMAHPHTSEFSTSAEKGHGSVMGSQKLEGVLGHGGVMGGRGRGFIIHRSRLVGHVFSLDPVVGHVFSYGLPRLDLRPLSFYRFHRRGRSFLMACRVLSLDLAMWHVFSLDLAEWLVFSCSLPRGPSCWARKLHRVEGPWPRQWRRTIPRTTPGTGNTIPCL